MINRYWTTFETLAKIEKEKLRIQVKKERMCNYRKCPNSLIKATELRSIFQMKPFVGCLTEGVSFSFK